MGSKPEIVVSSVFAQTISSPTSTRVSWRILTGSDGGIWISDIGVAFIVF